MNITIVKSIDHIAHTTLKLVDVHVTNINT